jgi:hypothetical protein
MAEQLLQAQLKNKHDKIINQYLPRSQEATISGQELGNTAQSIRNQYLEEREKDEIQKIHAEAIARQQEAQKAQFIMSLLNPGSNNNYQPNTGVSSPGTEAPNSGAPASNLSGPTNYAPGSGQAPYYPSSNQVPTSGVRAQNDSGGATNPMDAIKNIPQYARKLIGLDTEFPEEKQAREVSTDALKAQNKQSIERAQEIKELAKDLMLEGLDVDGIHDLLVGPDSLSTGIWAGVQGKTGWGTTKAGELKERAVRLQASMAHALSSKGGAGAAKIAEGGKPSIWKSTAENLGITKAMAQHISSEFKYLNDEYKTITGQDLPYTLPEFVASTAKAVQKHQFTPETKFTSDQEVRKYLSSLPKNERKQALKKIREGQS